MDGLQHDLAQAWVSITNYLDFDAARLAEPDMVARLILQVMLFVFSAFFSGSETALFSLSRLDLQKLRKDRNPHSETLHALLDQPRRLIMSILSGNELVNIAAAANMTAILVSLYGEARAGWINLLVMVPLILLFGEVTPKTIAVSNPLRISSAIVAPVMNVWVRVVFPLVWVIRAVADRITTWIVGEEKAAENILQIDEFRSLVEGVAREGEINATERALIYNLLEAGDVEIVEIMTPRTRTCFINVELSVPEMVARFRQYRHPRVPVFRKHRDELVGFIHCEDILRLVLDKVDLSKLDPEHIMHSPVVVPLTKKVDEMFDFFQNNQVRAAAVLNEFGGVEGIITMKDVVTFIFGQITGDITGQEHYKERDENVYDIPGDMKLNDFNNLTNFGIEDPRMTTIGGVAFRHLDCLPQVGDQVTIEGIRISVTKMDAHRIAQVRVARIPSTEEDTEGAQPEIPNRLQIYDLPKPIDTGEKSPVTIQNETDKQIETEDKQRESAADNIPDSVSKSREIVDKEQNQMAVDNAARVAQAQKGEVDAALGSHQLANQSDTDVPLRQGSNAQKKTKRKGDSHHSKLQ